ncbi:MAG: hypothetical protein VX035_03765, partial [Planctomycetota bacterium]|nr:hypothetical protein [Planctomycetota bacterium]
EGIEPGEQVATSGNFLIDSQMQLAGKPSLIDPTRYVRKFRNVPLEFDSIDISVIGGKSGEQLEELYSRYFEIRTAFAADKKPVEESSLSLHELSTQLTSSEDVTDQAKEQLSIVTENAEHLHHLPLEEARMQFKPISHAILELATQIRGEGNERVFRHFFCPMVKEGEGDWLQFEERISNPYYGSQMLRCGELIRTLPPENASSSEKTPVPADDPTGGDAEAGKPSPEAM